MADHFGKDTYRHLAPLPMNESVWQEVQEQLPFSPQQWRIVEGILRGAKDKEIAQQLEVSFHTVRTYLNRMFVRSGTKDRMELVLHIFALAQRAALKDSASDGCPQR